jgi:hypothetical protein
MLAERSATYPPAGKPGDYPVIPVVGLFTRYTCVQQCSP